MNGDGWVRQWPSGWLGPQGQFAERDQTRHWWVVTWPDHEVRWARTLRAAKEMTR